MKQKIPEPLLQTPEDQLSDVEKFKFASHGVRGDLHNDFRNLDQQKITDESEQIAKSHGVYLEYNRAKTGREKDWMYMVRMSVPGGGPLNGEQWHILDELADKFTVNPAGVSSLRLTTRQNVQFHWIKKAHLVELVRAVAETGFYTLNGCGDNTRNVMGCPLSRFSDIYNAHAKAHEFGAYFQLPVAPHMEVFAIDPNYVRSPEDRFEYGPRLLNRKFKFGFSAVHRDEHSGELVMDNCVELRTNDVGIAPVVEGEKVVGYQVYAGGGQGEKNGKPTFAALGKPFGVFTEENLKKGLDSIVKVQQEYGDRKNRHWARLKYVVQAKGIAWLQQQVRALGAEFEEPIAGFDPGARQLHHGWHTQPSNGKLAYGAYIENGRLADRGKERLKAMVRNLLDDYPIQAMITPNQDLLFTDIDPDAKESFERDMQEFGYGQRNGKPYSRLRMLSGACVGLHTCRLSYTESEQFEPQLMDQLEAMGYGDMAESVGITGCERQCFRPATKTIGWVGQGPNLYALKLGGSEDGRHQGTFLVDGEGQWYLRQVPRDEVSKVTAALFEFYASHRQSENEDMGALHRRIGAMGLIEYLTDHPETSHLMEKTFNAPYLPNGSVTPEYEI